MIVWSLNFWSIGKPAMLFVLKTGKRNIIRKIHRFIIFIIGLLGIALISYSTMNPYIKDKSHRENINVRDIYFVVDVSESMASIDFKPNRLESAKLQITQFITKHKHDRIGIILFAENLFTLMPLTIDNSIVKDSIKKIKIGFLGSGTNIGDAIALATTRLTKSKVKNKVIILLTDGVSNKGIFTPRQASKIASSKKIKIYTIGIGKLKNGNYLSNGKNGYRNIPGGSVDIQALKQISKITNGKFYYAGNEGNLKNIITSISQLETSQIKFITNKNITTIYFKYYILGLLLLLICEYLRRYSLKDLV